MYKTIVVHIDGGAQQSERVAAAALLARSFDGHLVGAADTGLSLMDYAALTASIGAPMFAPALDTDVEADFDGMRRAAAARLDGFAQLAARLAMPSYETRLVEDDARRALLLQSRYADLVVLSQDVDAGASASGSAPPAGAQGLGGRIRRLPEYLALRGARPVLVVPQGWQDHGLPETALAGWDGSTQALRAIGAALPLLQRVRSVKLVMVNPSTWSGLHGDLHGDGLGADMARYLARHGVRVELVVERTGEHAGAHAGAAGATVGAVLQSLARDCGAGLIVTGAYGHSRYREWMLGGVTRELLERAGTLLLIAH